MLVIRNAQRLAFLDTFVSWTTAYLRLNPSAQQLAIQSVSGGECDEAALRQFVETTCERGLAAGIEETRLLLRLILIAAAAEPAFLDGAQAARILNDRSRDANRRLDELAMYAGGKR